MNPSKYLSKDQLKTHIVWWLIILGYFNWYSHIPGSLAATIIGGILENANYLIVFYSLAIYTYPKYWDQKKYFMITFNLMVGFSLFSLINYLNYFKLVPLLGGHTFYERTSTLRFHKDNLLTYFIFGSGGVGYFFSRYSSSKIKYNAEREKELLKNEYNFIKNQFNSHITFNFLNFCFSKIHRQLPETAESIDIFSEILRYNLETRPEVKITLSKELSLIQNYIKLNRNLNSDVQIKFECIGDIENIQVVPHIIISIIESVFTKVQNGHLKPIIDIVLLIDQNKNLVLKIDTLLHENKKAVILSQYTNTEHLLNYYYHESYELKEVMEGGFFCIELLLKT
jgi:two-component system, LytTR family, sensor kinase